MTERAPPQNRSAYRAMRTITTRWRDNDAYGHMNNAVHYSLFDTVVNAWLIEEGVLDIQGSSKIGLVVESGCRYFAELGFPEVLQAGLRVGKIGYSSVRYEIALFQNQSDVAAAEGYFVHVYVDRATRRPSAIQERMRQRLLTLI